MAGKLLLAALLLACRPALAQSPEFKALCQRHLPAPTLKVKRVDAGYSVDRELSFHDLTGMGADLLRHGKQHVLGITRAELGANVEIRMARLEDETGGQECLSPQVVITVEHQPIKVFIGREFPPDSCSYREILAHELRHVRAYDRHLPRIQAGIRSRLARLFAGRILYGRTGEAEASLKAEITDAWLPAIEAEIHRVDETQARIDSAEEYNRMERVCDGEVQAYISGSE